MSKKNYLMMNIGCNFISLVLIFIYLLFNDYISYIIIYLIIND
jgi:hypothetical protein